METMPSEPAHLTGLYVRNFLANFAGNFIIVMLNMFTPPAVYKKMVFAFAVAVYVLFVAISLIFNFLAGRSILLPVKEMRRVVRNVRDGDFNQ